jgi:hypothetical protein
MSTGVLVLFLAYEGLILYLVLRDPDWDEKEKSRSRKIKERYERDQESP